MNVAISSRQRSLLLFLSASSFIAWYSGVGQRLEARDVAGVRVASMTALRERAPVRVTNFIERDPFAGSPSVRAASHDAHGSDDAIATTSNISDDASEPVPDIAGGVPVSDPTIAVAARDESPTLTVRATIVGRNSVAYVADGGRMDIVRVGDSLERRRIVRIDIDGITFDDGSRLALSNVYPRPSPRASGANSITLRLDQLRKMLTSPSRRSDSQAIDRPRVPTQEPTAIDPTPGPLMTVDSTGLAPGVNPTSNSSGPTAFPYPYPYPATHR